VRVDLKADDRDSFGLTFAAEVTEIEIKRTSDNLYEAFAIAKVPCPICRDVHAIKHLLERSSSILLQLANCVTCGESLDSLEEAARFKQDEDDNGVLTVHGRLHCRRCFGLSARTALVSADHSTGGREGRRSDYEFDVFLSSSSSERSVVEGIAVALRGAGLNPFLDVWHVRPGDPVQEALEHGLEASLATMVFIGPGGIGSWQNEELRSALEKHVTAREHRVIPVILPGVASVFEIPTFLRRLSWIDLRKGKTGETVESGMQTLISAARRATTTNKERGQFETEV
jgi:hypothetical protein